MRADSWPGLITKASPFALPPGAAVEQVNLRCSPGKLQSRDGMRGVAFIQKNVGSVGSIVHCHAVQHGTGTALIAQRADGTVVLLENPALARPATAAFDPVLSASAGEVVTSYTFRYLDGRYGATQDAPPQAPGDEFVEALDGGESDTALWPFSLDSVAGCPVSGKLAIVDGGVSRDDGLPPDVRESELCQT